MKKGLVLFAVIFILSFSFLSAQEIAGAVNIDYSLIQETDDNPAIVKDAPTVNPIRNFVNKVFRLAGFSVKETEEVGDFRDLFEVSVVPKDVDMICVWASYVLARKFHYDHFRPDFQKMAVGMAKGLMQSLDPYSDFLTKEEANQRNVYSRGSYGGLGIRIVAKGHRVIASEIIPNSPAERAGIKSGDIILAVGGVKIKNPEDVVKYGVGEVGTKVSLSIRRGDKTLDFELERALIEMETVKYETRMVKDKKISILKITGFDNLTPLRIGGILFAFQEAKPDALIIDLRGNPGGLLDSVARILNVFIVDKFVACKIEKGDGVMETMEMPGVKEDCFGKVPRVCLVDYGTASAGEVMAACLHDVAGVRLIGEQTFGKGSVQSIVQLKNGTAVKMTIAHWYTPKGVCIHGDGIAPDIEIIRTDEDVYLKKDPQMDKAVELLMEDLEK